MSLMICLSSSSFFLSDHLHAHALANTINQSQLNYALKHKYQFAYQYQYQHLPYGSVNWLSNSQKLAREQGDIAAKLAEFYLAEANVEQAIIWYKKAISLNYLPARLSLASLYFSNEDYQQVKRYLINSEQLTEQATLLLVKSLIAIGELAELPALIPQLRRSEQGRVLLEKLFIYRVISGDMADSDIRALLAARYLLLNRKKDTENCVVSLQLFATTVADLAYAEQLITAFTSHQLQASICLAVPRYIAKIRLKCADKTTQAIRCEESSWRELADDIDSRYIGVILPKGGANVHLGIMYLDRHDTVDVFAHEISHLLGFVDEYPLPPEHEKCSQVQDRPFAHNIVVLNKSYQGDRNSLRKQLLAQIPWHKYIKASTPIFQANGDTWLLGTPDDFRYDVGVFPADTCQSNSFSAFKPLKVTTQLRYFEEGFPTQYADFFTHAPFNYLMPSFHYNIAFALFNQHEITLASWWLQQAAKYETDIYRQEKILQGDF